LIRLTAWRSHDDRKSAQREQDEAIEEDFFKGHVGFSVDRSIGLMNW
jgi:hypothetical protein